MNIGEELVGDYLQFIKGCEFVQKNLYTKDEQGEIDVVGIELKTKKVYLCEVAIHLITGLQYVYNSKPNNVNKLCEKFSKDIEYARKYFPEKDGYQHHFMLWSPVVKNNQLQDISEIQQKMKHKYNVSVEAVINEDFLDRLEQLKKYAEIETKEAKSAVVRLYQIEYRTTENIAKLKKIKEKQ